ncbi:MAG: bifunctional 5,10-methylene-tetrahydrofolate dehydrogenase/5,10-methylene-tetrahydrofolate cyclohydrolase [Flavobacteriales bacterium]|nr:bifunctional 5,10-methylene-tetrahydrofolate dehydrogenase/5,10-methylene-tetrahydrofolate cyclohydrolase [Flavobacteriales bacterium]
MKILDGKNIANDIFDEIKIEVSQLYTSKGQKPHLVAILVGNNGASQTYVNAKVKACEYVGFKSTLIHLEDSISEYDLLSKINEINKNNSIDGLIVQLPLPDHISEKKVTESISPSKDVDGFHPENLGKMVLNYPTFLPATPAGILELLKRNNISTSGKHCVVLGRSNIVGLPISILMGKNNKIGNCTVTITHSRTKNIKEITKSADILIVALGKAEFISSDMIKKGVCIIDVGITRVKSDFTKSGWKLLGDVNFDSVKDKCSYITPVPGGVGPMTIAMLLKNTLKSFKLNVH